MRQEVAAADVREQADVHFRHRHLRTLGHDAQAAVRAALGDAHAAAHHHAIHQRNIRLRIKVDQMVQRVFFGKEVFQQGTVSHRRGMAGLVEEADVAAGAQRLFAAARDDDGVDVGIVAPGQQGGRDRAHHLQRQRVQGLGTVEGNGGGAVGNAGLHVFAHVLIIDREGKRHCSAGRKTKRAPDAPFVLLMLRQRNRHAAAAASPPSMVGSLAMRLSGVLL
jgi:hypothetical protein